MLKKILISLLLLIVIWLSFDLLVNSKYSGGMSLSYLKSISFAEYIKSVYFVTSVDKYFDGLYADNGEFRPDENTNSKLRPILFMGCSFTYGNGLEVNETVSAKTAKLTNRPVYNKALSGWGLDQLIYQLRREDFIKTIGGGEKEPEFLIYTFIPDQLGRIDKYKIVPLAREFQPHFKEKDNKLVELKPKFYHHLVLVEHILYNKYYSGTKTDDEIQRNIKLYFNEAYIAMRKHWRNTNFVILLFPQDNEGEHQDYILKLPCWKELEEKFIVININDLTGEKMETYKNDDGWHPSSEAWDIILPKLFDYLQIDYKK